MKPLILIPLALPSGITYTTIRNRKSFDRLHLPYCCCTRTSLPILQNSVELAEAEVTASRLSPSLCCGKLVVCLPRTAAEQLAS